MLKTPGGPTNNITAHSFAYVWLHNVFLNNINNELHWVIYSNEHVVKFEAFKDSAYIK